MFKWHERSETAIFRFFTCDKSMFLSRLVSYDFLLSKYILVNIWSIWFLYLAINIINADDMLMQGASAPSSIT